MNTLFNKCLDVIANDLETAFELAFNSDYKYLPIDELRIHLCQQLLIESHYFINRLRIDPLVPPPLRIPLEFWFSESPKLALPIYAIVQDDGLHEYRIHNMGTDDEYVTEYVTASFGIHSFKF